MEDKSVLRIEKPHLLVKLDESLLQVDLKEGARKELEKAVEKYPILRESLGVLLQTAIPLDVPLCGIDHAEVNSNGQVRVVIPLRKDLIIPLDAEESLELVEKINELIPLAKQKEAEREKRIESMEDRPRHRPEQPY